MKKKNIEVYKNNNTNSINKLKNKKKTKIFHKEERIKKSYNYNNKK